MIMYRCSSPITSVLSLSFAFANFNSFAQVLVYSSYITKKKEEEDNKKKGLFLESILPFRLPKKEFMSRAALCRDSNKFVARIF